jgi:NADPH:quinone reductase
VLAFTAAPGEPHLTFGEVADPVPRDDEVLVRVHASSLNRGEVIDLARRPVGALLGWDVAGVVRRPAADGSGPPAGARVVGMVRRGAWAQLAAVPSAWLAAIPDGVSDAQAATLPTAGLTALRALERGGLLLGKRVLVTGATGGVGGMAVQLARAGGAHVTALVRDAAGQAASMTRLGAAEVVQRLGDEQFQLVVDAVGGALFGQAIEHVAARGTVVNVGTPSADATVTFRSALLDRAYGATVVTLNLFDELTAHASGAADLARLGTLVDDGRLDTRIAAQTSWRSLATAMDRLRHRRVSGKIVIRVDDEVR